MDKRSSFLNYNIFIFFCQVILKKHCDFPFQLLDKFVIINHGETTSYLVFGVFFT